MSYIDRINHEHVGFFAGLPIYRPLEEYTPKDSLDGEFSCNPNCLVLGGGYLEHPGLVVRNLNYVAACYIKEWIDFCHEHKCSIYKDELTEEWAGILHEYLYGKDLHEILDCIHWSMRDYSDFYSSCKSNALLAPFIETERINEFEGWLASNFGELVVFSYPNLVSDESIRSLIEKVDRYLHGNIQILPAGFPTDHLGCVFKNGELQQGNRAWKVTKN